MAAAANDISSGAKFSVRYIGCLEIKVSMKTLDFSSRVAIAKECINRVCEAAGMKTLDKKRKIDRKVAAAIADKPDMEYAGSNVTASISTAELSLSVIETGAVIVRHEMSEVSFASGGDSDTLDFVSYTGKDANHGRACFVLECGSGLAADVLQAISQAFEVRFQQIQGNLKNTSTAPKLPLPMPPADPDYYNDMPGKVAPDEPPSIQTRKDAAKNLEPLEKVNGSQIDLIDLNHSPAPPKTPIKQAPEYVNTTPNSLDPFDMHMLSPVVPDAKRNALNEEEWFHGSISRHESESLVVKDGDFLVRESGGQYVLTGMQGGQRKHLLLVDPQGVVRTKDREFSSVTHLITYHRDNLLPIISAESALVLKTAVVRKRPPPLEPVPAK